MEEVVFVEAQLPDILIFLNFNYSLYFEIVFHATLSKKGWYASVYADQNIWIRVVDLCKVAKVLL